MVRTRQWSRPETNVCWETTCRHTVTFAAKVCCARTLFKAKFLFRLVLETLPAQSETYNALVVMVCSGERSTGSTQRITEGDTAQTERRLTRLVITARRDGFSVSIHRSLRWNDHLTKTEELRYGSLQMEAIYSSRRSITRSILHC